MLSNLFTLAASFAFCDDADFKTILSFIGYIFLVFKIAIPILLIAYGSIDLGKAVIAQKDDEIKKATGILVKRALAAVIIFFIPTIIGVIFNLVAGSVTDESFSESGQYSYRTCQKCFTSPGDCKSTGTPTE